MLFCGGIVSLYREYHQYGKNKIIVDEYSMKLTTCTAIFRSCMQNILLSLPTGGTGTFRYG